MAILAEATYLPDRTAKICFRQQLDFNYLEVRHLWEDAKADKEGLHLAGMLYRAIILDTLTYIPPEAGPVLTRLAENGRLIAWKNSRLAENFKGIRIVESAEDLKLEIDRLVSPSIITDPPSENIRYRHVIKEGDHYLIIFNEDEETVNAKLTFSVKGVDQWLDPKTGKSLPHPEGSEILFRPHELKLLRVITSAK